MPTTVADGAKFGCGCVLGIVALIAAGLVAMVVIFRAGAVGVQHAREKAREANERQQAK